MRVSEKHGFNSAEEKQSMFHGIPIVTKIYCFSTKCRNIK